MFKMILRFVLAFGICILLGGTMTECAAQDPVLKLVGSNVGVVGKSLTLTWNLTIFSDKQTPSYALILVARKGAPSFFTLLRTSFLNGDVARKEKLVPTKPETIMFNNITDMKNEGKTKFQLIITSVPINITSFNFKCQVYYADVWKSPTVNVMSVELASRPIVQFKVRKRVGNSTIGGSLDVVCAARGYPMPRVTLKKEHRSQVTEIKSAFQNVTYSVQNLKPSDAGKYICIAHNVADTVTEAVLVTVKYPPSVTFNIIKGTKSQHVVMGKDVKLVCSANGFPLPRVFLRKEVSSKVDEIENSLKSITYSISNIQPSDAGKFVCMAENIVGKATKEETITVSYINTTQTTPNELIAKIADQLVLACDITGFPLPAISWHKDGTKLPDTASKLTVKFNDDTHFGKYSCKGVNEAGEQKVSFSVVNTYIKRNTKQFHKITSKIGEKKILDCAISGHHKIIHTWFKGRTKIADSKTITVNLDNEEKFGNYTCMGRNNAGQEVILFSLTQQPIKSPRTKGGSSSTRTIFMIPIIGLSLLVTCVTQFIT